MRMMLVSFWFGQYLSKNVKNSYLNTMKSVTNAYLNAKKKLKKCIFKCQEEISQLHI